MSQEEDEVRAAARRIFRTDQAAKGFLASPIHDLGGTPMELTRSGRADEVLAYLARLEREAPAQPFTTQSLFAGWLGRFGGKR